MYLKSLVLKGFKSFADRSVISLEPGITAVVGPNGSGKSNISDSVLWVLGERNAKNLRGQAMEDVIFAGSSARKAVGVAEVDLVLDNSDGTLPIEYSEVSLTRRMYRSGLSEYLINGSPARRMDVLDILHDSGLGTGTHSIISQGHLSSILQSKPEDRRALIEEAAGVLKHKQRKQKSERKLAQMDEHLTRVQDITAEVERQIKPLERKAKRAMAYQDLASELATLNLQLAVDDLRVLQKGWDGVVEQEKNLVEETQNLHGAIAAAEEAAEALQKQLQEQSDSAGVMATKYRRAQTALDRLDSTVVLFHEKKRSMQSYSQDLQLTLAAEQRKAQELEKQREEAQSASTQAEEVADAAATALSQARDAAERTDARRAELQKAIDEGTHRRRVAINELEEVRAAQAKNMEVLSSSRAHEKLISARTGELELQLEAARSAAEAAESTKTDLSEKLLKLQNDEAACRDGVTAAFTARQEAVSAFDEAHNVLVQHQAEVKGLEELERARTAANPLLSWMLEHTDRTEQDIAPLIDVIGVPAGLESVVEQLLGADIAALFVRDSDGAAAIADRLYAVDESGSVTLMPRSTKATRVSVPDGATMLIDQLTYPDEAAGAVSALLGDVAVVDSAQEATRLAQRHEGLCCATRDGLIVWPNGKVTFSRVETDRTSALESHRSLEAARAEVKRAEEVRDAADKAKTEAEQALRDVQSQSLALSQQLAQLKGQTDSAVEEAARTAEKLDAFTREYESLEAQRAQAAEVLAKAEPDAEQLAARLDKLNTETDELKIDIDAKRREMGPIREAAQAAASALAEAKVAAATSQEKATYAKRMLLAREQDIRSAQETAERARANIRNKNVGLTRIDPLIDLFNSFAAAAKRHTDKLERETSEAQDSSAGMHARINDARAKARAAHDSFDAANERLSTVRVEKGRMEMQVEAAINTIVDDCHTPIETALAMPELEERRSVEDHAFKLRRRITNMGTINPDAAAEYEQLKVRYDYLSGQLQDMLSARRTLEKIVHVIDVRMKDDFINTFETVNRNYQEIFATLFPGGSGSLSLVDPDDPENTGVEVQAQPNGKRILKMSLMSGGEQSLVAMALLFAVYKTRSTPFYILDEIEAALDDTNLRRLCAYLNSMRDTTQLIMITHQRRTMEMADVLYGISMQADGVTKVMSQRLDKALKYAEG